MSDILELSKPASFVMMRAAAEAAAMHRTRLRFEYVFLGLLKLPEVRATELDPHPEPAVQPEIDAVATRLGRHGVQPRETRALLREALRDGRTFPEAPDAEEQLHQFLQEAERRARQAGQRTLTAETLLELALEQASAPLRKLCGIRGLARTPNPSPAPPVSPHPIDPPDRAYLIDLTARIHALRCHLLTTVLGQNHVVHAFAEAMFNADVLAAVDEQRVRPRAILVFAGPPGVGKTFFAEQAAEALGLPFKRFDMSGYADHEQHNELVGFAASYKSAHPGTLTDFVAKNPHCILLFDEIEKAHQNVIQLFLQILDAGRLQDKFSEEQIPFRDTIIIFTTNAGRALYEGEGAAGSAAALTRQTILSALEREVHPQTGRPVFPAAICSRLATGWPIVFNHLQAHDLELIASKELQRCGGLLEKQYGIPLTFDELLPTALLFAEGGLVDARTLRAQTEIFIKAELFRLCGLFNTDSFSRVMGHLKGIQLNVEHQNLSAEVAALFNPEAGAEIIVFGGEPLAQRCREALPNLRWHGVTESTAAFALLGERDIRLVLLPPAQTPRQAMAHETVAVFDYLPLAASVFQDARHFFQMLRARLPGVPVYLLEVNGFEIDDQLEMAFVRDGARGKLRLPARGEGSLDVFGEEVNRLCRRLHRQQMAGQLAATGQVLRFDTAPLLDEQQGIAAIRLRQLVLQRVVSAQDMGEVLDDARRPEIRFADVIGASAAKEELDFFVDYLRHPKRFAALGLKPPKGVLLYGPPGTGKTMLAKAMAGESGVAFIATAASAFVTKWQGSGPEAVRALFARARRYAPAVVFIDEIDAIGRARGQSDSAHGEEMALNALLTEMDGFATDPRRPVFVLAATNFEIDTGRRGIGVIDPALARRFDRSIRVDLPDKAVRREYLRIRLGRYRASVEPAAIERLAGRAVGLSQADLERVIELGARLAAKACEPLTDVYLEEALELTRHGEEKSWGPGFLERVARHEAGHAFLYWSAGKTPAYLTIVARGDHGGYMEHDDEDVAAPLHTRRQMLDRLRTALGGRAAELLYYGSDEGLSTGAAGDLESATRLAKAMICRYGMDETIGPVALTDAESGRGPLAAVIAERVRILIEQELAAAREQLQSAQPALDRLVDALLDQGRLTGEEIERVLGES